MLRGVISKVQSFSLVAAPSSPHRFHICNTVNLFHPKWAPISRMDNPQYLKTKKNVTYQTQKHARLNCIAYYLTRYTKASNEKKKKTEKIPVLKTSSLFRLYIPLVGGATSIYDFQMH